MRFKKSKQNLTYYNAYEEKIYSFENGEDVAFEDLTFYEDTSTKFGINPDVLKKYKMGERK
mgnify:CR=1 FL=1